MSAPRGQLVVMSGPSGTGKTTIKERLRRHPAVTVAVTVTTREPRAGEIPDRDYHFVSREQFLAMQAEGRFAETNDVFGNGHLYGSLRTELEAALAQPGRVYLMEVDVTGAENLRRAGYDGTFIFIAPPSMEVLERRLRERRTDSAEAISRRLARAAEEIAAAHEARGKALERNAGDRVVILVNETIDATVAQVFALLGLQGAAPADPAPHVPAAPAPHAPVNGTPRSTTH
jgi:guanylate kinase